MASALRAQLWLLLVEVIAVVLAMPIRRWGIGIVLAPLAASVVLLVVSVRRQSGPLFGTFLLSLVAATAITIIAQEAYVIRLGPRVEVLDAEGFLDHRDAAVIHAPGFRPRPSLAGAFNEEIDGDYSFYTAAPLVDDRWTPDQPIAAWAVCGEPESCEWDLPSTAGYAEDMYRDEYRKAVDDAVAEHGLRSAKDNVLLHWRDPDAAASESARAAALALACAHAALAAGFAYSAIQKARHPRTETAEEIESEEPAMPVALTEGVRGLRIANAAAKVLAFRRSGFFSLRAHGVIQDVAVTITSNRRGLEITAKHAGIPAGFVLMLEDEAARRPRLTRSLVREQVHTGDPAFDARIFVRGQEATALAVLSLRGRRAALEALTKIGSTVRAGSLQFAGRWPATHRDIVEMVWALFREARSLALRTEVPAALLENVESDPEPGVRAACVRALRRHLPDGPETARAIEVALRDSHPDVQAAARDPEIDAGRLSIAAAEPEAGALSRAGETGTLSDPARGGRGRN